MRDILELFDSPWGRRVLDAIEKKVRAEIVAEAIASVIWIALSARFPAAPEEIRNELGAIKDESRLDDLSRWAAICPDLAAFQARLKQA